MAMPVFAAAAREGQASCPGKTASGVNAGSPGAGGERISNLAESGLIDEFARANGCGMG